MSTKPWTEGPVELLKHGLDHLKLGTDFDTRMAMICIDNAVELMMKTYLGLPERVTHISGLSKTKYDELIGTFPKLLIGLETYAPDKVLGFELENVEWYHRLRNQLYHEGNGVTVGKQTVEGYAAIAKIMCSNLFGIDADKWPSLAHPDTLTGEFLVSWSKLEKYMIGPTASQTSRINVFKAFEEHQAMLSESDRAAYKNLSLFRNRLVHRKTSPSISDLRRNLDTLNELLERLVYPEARTHF